MSTDKEFVLQTLENFGKVKALEVTSGAIAKTITDTEIVEQEGYVPDWRPKNYPTIGQPVRYDGYVWAVWQAHDSTSTPNWNPLAAPSLFRIVHTKDPAKAKPYMEQEGNRRVYNVGDVMIWTDGKIYKSKIVNNSWTPVTHAAGWEVVN